MGRHKPKFVPLTSEQTEAINILAHDMLLWAGGYAAQLHAWHAGTRKTRPERPEQLDPQVARVTEEWLDGIGLRAEEIVMEPFDVAA